MILGFTREELLAELLLPPRRAFVPLPDTEELVRPGLRLLSTPSLRQGGLNEVSLAVLPEEEVALEAAIDATVAHFQGRAFRWLVGPDSRPADLGARLSRRGLRLSQTQGMVRRTDPLPRDDDDASGVTVEPVDAGNVDAYTEVMAAGWRMDPAPLDPLHRRMVAEDGPFALFLGRVAGQPAGAAALFRAERSVFLQGAVVLPAQRRRGVYRALLLARLAAARAQGIPLCTTHAMSDSSAPILAALGFVTVCPLPYYLQGASA